LKKKLNDKLVELVVEKPVEKFDSKLFKLFVTEAALTIS
jgi:hypothetical protein